jgi:NAD-dependent epimerase/dehydratase family protein
VLALLSRGGDGNNYGVRVAVLGGTGFIGSHVVGALVEAGHDVIVFHRGVDEPGLLIPVRHVHGSFVRLAEYRHVFQQLKPQVVLDMVPSIDKGDTGSRISVASRSGRSSYPAQTSSAPSRVCGGVSQVLITFRSQKGRRCERSPRQTRRTNLTTTTPTPSERR